MNLLFFLVGLAPILFFPPLSAQDLPEDPLFDILCETEENRPFVEEIPEPFNNWVVILCSPIGQILAPEIGVGTEMKGIIWTLHGTFQPFRLEAIPAFPGREDVAKALGPEARFIKFAGEELTGIKREMTLKMFARAFSEAEDDLEFRTYQLDVLSVFQGQLYNIFFFVKNGKPQHILFCIDRCNKSVSVDVWDLEELQARLKEQNQE